MPKTIVIGQPRYLPAINYLQRLYNADVFVFLDTVQRQGRGWENRNKIIEKDEKEKWITIPISSSSRANINKTIICGNDWIEHHKDMLKQAYFKHPYFYEDVIERYYEGVEKVLEQNEFNYSPTLIQMIKNACAIFDFTPHTITASECENSSLIGNAKLLSIAKNLQANIYVSGENGRQYNIKETFSGSGVEVKFHEFNYPVYTQFNSTKFYTWLCFFDIIFNIGLEKTSELIIEEWNLSD